MRHWTVMLIPHGEGSTRNLNLYSFQIWLVIGVFAALTFTSTFSLQLYRTTREAVAELEMEKREWAQERANIAARAPQTALPEAAQPVGDVKAIEERLRAEYEEALDKINVELSEMWELEKRIRENADLPPRTTAPVTYAEDSSLGQGGGMGGPPVDAVAEMFDASDSRLLPPSITYGLARPSADLNYQEIQLRIASFRELLVDMEARAEELARMPVAWPTTHQARRITSTFGNRRDPFSKRLRHHDGLDISVPYRSAVVATGLGTVVEAGWDRYLGNHVAIDHGEGRVTVYGHMSRLSVSKGQKVNRGDKIGEVGSTGKSTGNHIHYEVRLNGKPVNPMKYIN